MVSSYLLILKFPNHVAYRISQIQTAHAGCFYFNAVRFILGESSRSSRLRPNRSLGFLLCFRNNFSQRYISIHPVTLCTSTITPKFLNEWRTVVIVYTWAVKISPQHPCFCTRYHNRRQSFSTNDIMSSIGHKHIYRALSFWI